MLKALTQLIESALGGEGTTGPVDREHALRLATAILLVEIERADYARDPAEEQTMLKLLEGFFDLSEDETRLLLDEARLGADDAASLQSFTRQLHESLSLAEKHQIVEMLWRVALADDHLDKHEDHLVRKIAGLLYVSHGDVIRIRNQVVSRQRGTGVSR
jgi:uncharacterized tellurite resistance protein B-like protein